LAISIAVVCTTPSGRVLAYMTQRSMSKRNFNVEPNTLVAFLATLARAALIYLLAECVEQC
jgi:hypothetical protein